MGNSMQPLEHPERSPRARNDPDHIHGIRDVSINTASQSRFVGVMKNQEWFSRRHHRDMLSNCSDKFGVDVVPWGREEAVGGC